MTKNMLYMLVVCFTGLVNVDFLNASDSGMSPEIKTVKRDWEVGVQAYSYRNFGFFDTLDKLSDMGIGLIEAYPGQRIGGGIVGSFSHDMDESTRKQVKSRLEEKKIRLVSYGVVNAGSEDEWRKIFDFAKDMAIETVVTEPPQDQMAVLAKLSSEYNVKVGIHNHLDPRPEQVLSMINGRGANVGAAPDNGHWARANLDLIKSMKMFEGHIVSIHLKDVDKRFPSGECVPLGTGVCDIPSVLAELDRQDYRGKFILEYESDPQDPSPAIKQCVIYFNYAAKLSGDDLRAGRILPPGYSWDINDVYENVDLFEPAGREDPEEALGGNVVAAGKTAVGSVITASKAGYTGEGPEKAFDGDKGSKYCLDAGTFWLQIKYPNDKKHKVTGYAISSANDSPGRDPREWKVMGSNDGEKWDVVDEQKGNDFASRFERKEFKTASPGEYIYYRLDVSLNHGDSISQISEWELLEETNK